MKKINCDQINLIDLWKRSAVIKLISSIFEKDPPWLKQSRQSMIKSIFWSQKMINSKNQWLNSHPCKIDQSLESRLLKPCHTTLTSKQHSRMAPTTNNSVYAGLKCTVHTFSNYTFLKHFPFSKWVFHFYTLVLGIIKKKEFTLLQPLTTSLLSLTSHHLS